MADIGLGGDAGTLQKEGFCSETARELANKLAATEGVGGGDSFSQA